MIKAVWKLPASASGASDRAPGLTPHRMSERRPLVVHLLFRFDTGGLENGVVNLINHMDASRWRHAVVAMTEVTEFRRRIQREDVQFLGLNKPPGPGVLQWGALYRMCRELRPDIVHSRNLAALEGQLPAWLARVPARIHGEHGRDMDDVDGLNRRNRLTRRFYSPFVQRYVALSRDLGGYLENAVGIAPHRIHQIYNGVDTDKFLPRGAAAAAIEGCPFQSGPQLLVGTVGRMQSVKDQLTLARAFVLALQQQPGLRERLRLVMAGDGPLRAQVAQVLAEAGMSDLAYLPGERRDVAELMRGLDVFALPSLAEGVSNTILEAMACGLPVLATRVGGNAELVEEGRTGLLVPSADVPAMAAGLIRLAQDAALRADFGQAGRQRVEQRFSLRAMVAAYDALYSQALGRPPLDLEHGLRTTK